MKKVTSRSLPSVLGVSPCLFHLMRSRVKTCVLHDLYVNLAAQNCIGLWRQTVGLRRVAPDEGQSVVDLKGCCAVTKELVGSDVISARAQRGGAYPLVGHNLETGISCESCFVKAALRLQNFGHVCDFGVVF